MELSSRKYLEKISLNRSKISLRTSLCKSIAPVLSLIKQTFAYLIQQKYLNIKFELLYLQEVITNKTEKCLGETLG